MLCPSRGTPTTLLPTKACKDAVPVWRAWGRRSLISPGVAREDKVYSCARVVFRKKKNCYIIIIIVLIRIIYYEFHVRGTMNRRDCRGGRGGYARNQFSVFRRTIGSWARVDNTCLCAFFFIIIIILSLIIYIYAYICTCARVR